MHSKITFNTDRRSVLKKISKVDLVCTDLDECLLPFYASVILTAHLLVASLFRAELKKCRFRLSVGVVFVFLLFMVTFGKVGVFSKSFLMKCFAFTVKGVPKSVLLKHCGYLHELFSDGAVSFLDFFYKRGARVSILSLSIETILEAISSNLSCVTDYAGNPVCFDKDDCFLSYGEKVMVDASGKENYFNMLLDISSSVCPLVIGHSKDELQLVRQARKVGGVSIGINPDEIVKAEFDVVVIGDNWNDLLQDLVQGVSEVNDEA